MFFSVFQPTKVINSLALYGIFQHFCVLKNCKYLQKMSHPIYFVSLGPGDAELITLKSLHALLQADIIYCPSTVREPDKILSRAATLLHKLGIKGDIHLFSLPMSKDRTKAIKIYRQLFEEMRLEQKAGKRLAVAVEGDAGIYASVHYVLDLLEENGIPVEQLPGIPSFIAAEAAAKLHLISQKERLVIIPGNITSDELDMYLSHHHVPVIMKLSQCADIVQDYMESHPQYSYHYFENISTAEEYHSSHQAELKRRVFPYFSLMIIFNEQTRKDDSAK
jgi:precorrin-2/cobalt-factor-2 C20-methyltransferase